MPNLTEPEDVKLPATVEELEDLVKRAQAGDISTLPVLQKISQNDAGVDYLGGNLARRAQEAFIVAMAGTNLALQIAVTKKMETLRSELAGPSPTPIERLLAERAIACWLQMQDADLRFAQAKDQSIRQAEFMQNRMDRAHRRYLSALKTLALVRKMAVPVIQMNFAKKQVNVVGASPEVGREAT